MNDLRRLFYFLSSDLKLERHRQIFYTYVRRQFTICIYWESF